jgi:hypothetical protein
MGWNEKARKSMLGGKSVNASAIGEFFTQARELAWRKW